MGMFSLRICFVSSQLRELWQSHFSPRTIGIEERWRREAGQPELLHLLNRGATVLCGSSPPPRGQTLQLQLKAGFPVPELTQGPVSKSTCRGAPAVPPWLCTSSLGQLAAHETADPSRSLISAPEMPFLSSPTPHLLGPWNVKVQGVRT